MLYKKDSSSNRNDLTKQFIKDFSFDFDGRGLTNFESNNDIKENFYIPYPRYWNYPPVYRAHLPMLDNHHYNRNARWWYLDYSPYTSPPRRNWFYWRNYFYG